VARGAGDWLVGELLEHLGALPRAASARDRGFRPPRAGPSSPRPSAVTSSSSSCRRPGAPARSRPRPVREPGDEVATAATGTTPVIGNETRNVVRLRSYPWGEREHARSTAMAGLGLAGDSGPPNHAGPAYATLSYLCLAATGRGSYRSPRPPSPSARVDEPLRDSC
jgi:hypothetical protein